MKSVNNKDYKDYETSWDALAAKMSETTKQIIAVVGTPANIDRAVERYAEHYFETDEEFEGDTLEEYKEYMRDSLLLYLVINIGADSEKVKGMSYHETNKYTTYKR